MIASHTLAREIIDRSNDPCPILDSDELALLSQFVAEPSRGGALLEARDLTGSLVAHVIILHGTEKAVLTEEEIKTLKEWFENGQKA
ncbi:hypothetical protein CTA2_5457 [Colletotrichum tanaceti]|uniref:Uncharacterized protein n=1 Tax=Colletotrichum tanaceti TaxID=1306861 RepID=A0A4U6X6U3_9PEZI|nr:hypothetical protein CTA2_5457 [Colletotrichum tanaceti]TKW51180.1 hypothetical protein CTA1_1497 [Colletotrichum tanaceti]